MIHEVIIVGSGPTGVASALGFAENGIVPLMLDVGHEPRHMEPPEGSFYAYKKRRDTFNLMIGENYEGLQNVIEKKTPSPKVSSPYMNFVIKDSDTLTPIIEKGAPILQSFSMGGLANAWGAGLYRCVDDDLANLPLKESELSPYFDTLTKEIGISGDDDDLTQFFGSTKHILKPLKLSEKTENLYSKYKKKKNDLNARGIYVGRPRLGVLSEPYDGRAACDYSNLDMWVPHLPYIYSPAYTLQKLVKNKTVMYRKSIMVTSWTRENDHLIVHGEDISDKSKIAFKCKRLVLAAGTVNSTKIVLNSKKDFNKKLRFIDKTLVQLPLISPSFIGRKFEEETFALTNLNVVFDLKKFGVRLQGSIIELSSPARSVFYEMFPFAARDNLAFIRFFLPAVLILFLYFPPTRENAGYLMLHTDNRLEIDSPPEKINKSILSEIVHAFIHMGVLAHSLLMKPPTHALQYSGTLPMVEHPDQRYQCDKKGELFMEPGVHVVDGSLFSSLPSKNNSFTMMANAMRIANDISKMIKKQ